MNKQILVLGVTALIAILWVMQVRGADKSEAKYAKYTVAMNGNAKDDDEEKAEGKHAKDAAAKKHEAKEEDDEKDEGKAEVKHGKETAAKKGKAKDEDDEKDEEKAEGKHAKDAAAKKSKAKDEDDEKDEKAEGKHAKDAAVKKGEAKEEDDEKGEGKAEAKSSGKVPGPVLATVKELVGKKGKVLELAREKDGTYELDYQLGGVHQAAIIATDGSIQEREITVKASELPKAALEAVKKHYPKGKITLAEKSTTKDGVVYELSVSIQKSITVTPEGKVKEGGEED